MITLNRLQQIIPADQALANKALSVALTQINGLNFVGLPAFGRAVKNLETTQSLPLVTALQQAVPPSVANFLISLLAVGKGANGNVQLVDILGLAGGWIAVPNFLKTVEIFNTMNLSTLTLIYQTMTGVLNGTYNSGVDPDGYAIVTIPLGLPGAGTYNPVTAPNPGIPPPVNILVTSAANVAMSTALIPAALVEIANLQATYPAQCAELNSLWTEMAEQVDLEQTLQAEIKLVWADLTPNDRTSIFSLIYSLPEYGLQNQEGGAGWLLEKMANLSTLSGESIIGAMREGRNQAILNNVGIVTNSRIPGEPIPPPPEAELLPSVYTEAEAQILVAK
jgi:hypothetical protein